MSNSWKDILNHQHGQGFTMALIVLAVTALLSVPLLGFLSSVLHRSSANNATLNAQYSVDAGTEDAMWRIEHDPAFVQELVKGNTQTYIIKVNGKDVTITVTGVPFGPPPIPEPVPTPSPGVDPLIWSSISPSVINMLQRPPPPTVRLTIFIADGSRSATTMTNLIDVLPKGYTYAGNLAWTHLVYKNNFRCGRPDGHCAGDPFVLTDPDLEPPLSASKNLTGPNPWQSCVAATRSDAGADWKRLEWQWVGNNIPSVVRNQTATISFDITVPSPLSTAYADNTDNPWGDIGQNQCTGGGQSQLQPGRASKVLVYFYSTVNSTQGATTNLTSQLDTADKTKITAQSFGD